MQLPVKILDEIERYSKEKNLSEGKKQEVIETARKYYTDIQYDSQEPVGVIAAQSLSEPTTQMTMRTYHFAGTAGIQVTLGLPRLLEIFDARKKPKTPTMTVYLLPEYQTEEKAKAVAENIKESKLKDVVVSDTINLTDLEIECKLSLKALKAMGIEPESLNKRIKLRNIDLEVKGDVLIAKYKKPEIRDIFKMKYKLLESYLKGIKGVSQTVVNKGDEQWKIMTLGSDLKKALKIEGVDTTKTVSNNIFEVLDVLGVEAGRNAIIQQAMYTIEEQGLGIDVRYLMLLADLMTMDGTIRPIGRYGVVGHKQSVLARAAFEETKKHIVKAAVKGETDLLQGVVENVMVNQVVPVGTGSYNLFGRIVGAPVEAQKEEIPETVGFGLNGNITTEALDKEEDTEENLLEKGSSKPEKTKEANKENKPKEKPKTRK